MSQDYHISRWWLHLDAREQAQVQHAVAYAQHYAKAGIAAHGHYLLIAKLVDLLDTAEEAAHGQR